MALYRKGQDDSMLRKAARKQMQQQKNMNEHSAIRYNSFQAGYQGAKLLYIDHVAQYGEPAENAISGDDFKRGVVARELLQLDDFEESDE